MIPGETKIKNERWENFSKTVAVGMTETVAYMESYDIKDRKTAKRAAYRLMKNERVIDRIGFLVKQRTDKKSSKSGVNLQSVIGTCQDIIDRPNGKISDKMSAISTLNKLGVFDNETKDEIQRMDPGAICEYMASFAAAPANELAKIPGGLRELMQRLMALTGANNEAMKAAIDEPEYTSAVPEQEPEEPEEPTEKPNEQDECGLNEGSGEVYQF